MGDHLAHHHAAGGDVVDALRGVRRGGEAGEGAGRVVQIDHGIGGVLAHLDGVGLAARRLLGDQGGEQARRPGRLAKRAGHRRHAGGADVHAVAAGVQQPHLLGTALGVAVPAVRLGGHGLVDRLRQVATVHADGAGQHHPATAARARRIQHVEAAADVHRHARRRVAVAAGGQHARQMDDGILLAAALHCRPHRRGVANVAADIAHSGRPIGAGRRLGRRHVEGQHVAPRGDEVTRQRPADEPGTAGDQNCHVPIIPCRHPPCVAAWVIG